MAICKLALFRTVKLRLLSSWGHQEKRKWLDELLFCSVISYWFRFEYLSEKNPNKRELLKQIAMGGESGREWAKYYGNQAVDLKKKIGHLTYEKANPVLPELDAMLSRIAKPVVVVQVGSSSGREIAWLAERNTRHAYIGTDAYPEVIEFSSVNHKTTNLRFELCAAKDIAGVVKKYEENKIIMFSSGSLQYVQPEHLEIFFDSISCIPNLELLVLEPASESKGDPKELVGSLWRGNFSYTHNYRSYAEKAGFIAKTCEIIRPYAPHEHFPMHRGTVHYFYWGRTEMACGNVQVGNRDGSPEPFVT